jgi:hypothetical protein
MLGRQSPQDVLNPYAKKKPFFPIFVTALAVVLVLIGIAIIVMWLTGGSFAFNPFSKEPTPTATMPPTPVMSPTATFATETPTPAATIPDRGIDKELTIADISIKHDVDRNC